MNLSKWFCNLSTTCDANAVNDWKTKSMTRNFKPLFVSENTGKKNFCINQQSVMLNCQKKINKTNKTTCDRMSHKW